MSLLQLTLLKNTCHAGKAGKAVLEEVIKMMEVLHRGGRKTHTQAESMKAGFTIKITFKGKENFW